MTMRTMSGLEFFRHARELEVLNHIGKAKPIGRVKADDPLVMVCTDKRSKVVLLGVVPKANVRV